MQLERAEYTEAKQVKLGTTEHLLLDHLQTVDLALGGAIPVVSDAYNSIYAPSSTKRFGGKRKKSMAGRELLLRSANRCSRQSAIPGRFAAKTCSRPKKKLTADPEIANPLVRASVNARGT